jgi:hypothetical protein
MRTPIRHLIQIDLAVSGLGLPKEKLAKADFTPALAPSRFRHTEDDLDMLDVNAMINQSTPHQHVSNILPFSNNESFFFSASCSNAPYINMQSPRIICPS